MTSYFQLYQQFLLRDLRARYKQTFVGFGWAVIQPLVMMVIFTIIFGRFAKIPSEGIPYPIFSYAALLPWIFFASGISKAIPSLVSNRNLINKTYFPREVFILSAILVSLFDFLIASSIPVHEYYLIVSCRNMGELK